MSRVIVTGANSFIGRRLCKVMTENGYQVCAIVRNGFKNTEIFEGLKNFSLIHADMCEYDKLPQKVDGIYDIGIALAWNGTRGNDRNDFVKQQENYKNSIRCVNSFVEIGCQVIMTAGSQAEYGSCLTNEKVKETDTCNPNTEYGKFKLQFYIDSAKICEEKKVRLIEPRYFSLYGPDDSEKTMIISVARKMLLDEPCKMTKCVQLWDFLYIDDAIRALMSLLQSKDAEGIYNFGSGVSRQLKDYIEVMYRLSQSKSKLMYGEVPYPATGIVHTNPSIDRLRNAIDWHPRISFEEGIKQVIQTQKEVLLRRYK